MQEGNHFCNLKMQGVDEQRRKNLHSEGDQSILRLPGATCASAAFSGEQCSHRSNLYRRVTIDC
jgi:hypothetical protein